MRPLTSFLKYNGAVPITPGSSARGEWGHEWVLKKERGKEQSQAPAPRKNNVTVTASTRHREGPATGDAIKRAGKFLLDSVTFQRNSSSIRNAGSISVARCPGWRAACGGAEIWV